MAIQYKETTLTKIQKPNEVLHFVAPVGHSSLFLFLWAADVSVGFAATVFLDCGLLWICCEETLLAWDCFVRASPLKTSEWAASLALLISASACASVAFPSAVLLLE